MNWAEISAIGQMLGAIAVFITLAYLAVQLRQARRETRRGLSQGRGEAVLHLMDKADDERFCTAFVKANTALGQQPLPVVAALMQQAGVTEEVAFHLMSNELSWWSYRLQMIPNIDELPAMERTFFDRGCLAYGQPSVHRVFYETFVKPTQHPDAVRYIDNLLAQEALTSS